MDIQVIIAENDAEIQNSIKHKLLTPGMNTNINTIVTSEAAIRENISRNTSKIDIILIDLNMIKSLRNLTKFIRQYGRVPEIVVIIRGQTAYEITVALENGATGYIHYNASLEEYRKAIYNAINRRSIITPDVAQEIKETISKYQVHISAVEENILNLTISNKSLDEIVLLGNLYSEEIVTAHLYNLIRRLQRS